MIIAFHPHIYIIALFYNNEVCGVSLRFLVMDELRPCDRQKKL
jgi:hypothetical protein